MKKRYLLSAIGASAAGYLLINKKNRQKLKTDLKSLLKSVKNTNEFSLGSTLEDDGRPDQPNNQDLEQLQVAKVVFAVSPFGVIYYNVVKENFSVKIYYNYQKKIT